MVQKENSREMQITNHLYNYLAFNLNESKCRGNFFFLFFSFPLFFCNSYISNEIELFESFKENTNIPDTFQCRVFSTISISLFGISFPLLLFVCSFVRFFFLFDSTFLLKVSLFLFILANFKYLNFFLINLNCVSV